MAAAIRIDDADGVRVVRWERADALNAMSLDMWDATRDALDSATDDGIRCIVLTGSGRAFNVGQDLAEMADPRQADESRGYRGVMRALQDVPVPLVAAVNGLAVGFGVTVLPWCDFVLVSDAARFRVPFVSLGVTTEAASSVTLPEIMGPQAAAHFVLTGDWLSAEDAVATGLAWRVVPGRAPGRRGRGARRSPGRRTARVVAHDDRPAAGGAPGPLGRRDGPRERGVRTTRRERGESRRHRTLLLAKGRPLTRFVESSITFPYKRSLGPVIGAFMTGLTEQRILGIRSGDRVLVPPLEWDPQTGAELDADGMVEVGPAGTVESWTWVPDPVGATSARSPVRVRAHPARRRVDTAAARGRRRLARRARGRRTASHRDGAAPVPVASTTSSPSCPARSPRSTAPTPGRRPSR